MRIKKNIEEINYDETKKFFKNRSLKFNENNPYSVTMYQDNNQKLVEERNKKEVEKILPLLQIDPESRILDVACGIGRWADAIEGEFSEYCGVDFSEELINIANNRNHRKNVSFVVGTVNEIGNVVKNKGLFNKILVIGILVYLNDSDVLSALNQIESVCDKNAVICIREPIGIEDRLTLKDHFSNELNDNYNAIYRNRKELSQYFDTALIKKGFQIRQEGFLFDNELNNRKETAQYFYILER